MKLEQIRIYKYSMPFKQPVKLKGIQYDRREGILISLIDTNNRIGWGEIAPLPGFSSETLNESLEQLKMIIPKLKESEFEIINQPNWSASVNFGIEMAIQALSKNSDTKIKQQPVNCLITSLDNNPEQFIPEKIKEGYQRFKIKIGRTAIQTEIEILKNISNKLPVDCRLRLDANRTWDYEQAIRFCENIKNLPIEYIEEPLTDAAQLPKLAKNISIPLALDESLLEPLGQSLIGQPGIDALILKPTLIGGLNKTMELVKQGLKNRMTVVISSSYESPLGINYLGSIAHSISPDTAHGLDTIDTFENSFIKNQLSVKNGKLEIRNQADYEIDMSQLTEVSYD